MRLIALGFALAVSTCGPTSVADLQESGQWTPRYESDKTPMEFAGCVMRAYDAQLTTIHLAHMRPTPTGLEVLKAITVMGRPVIIGAISIDAVDEGSSITGVATTQIGSSRSRLREVDAAIRECI